MIKPDQIVGRHFRIISKIGSGGMGHVYKAHDQNLGRDVAIKFLLTEGTENEELSKRFINEGKILATINHPAVISVYASDIDELLRIPFLVMELVDGNPLSHYKDGFLADPAMLVKYFMQLLEGINACHEKGIIHRDIKPANILINRSGQLKILDFGVAKTAQKQTRTGIALGTPHYMSPEQCLGKTLISPKADVYSIGIMLWEFVTGDLPYEITTEADDPALSIALMHLNDPIPLEDLRKKPKAQIFENILAKMLAKHPDERPEISEIISYLNEIAKQIAPAAADSPTENKDEDYIGGIYQVKHMLGEGGMGKVYKALDTALNRTVALKVLQDEVVKDESIVERFIREGQLLATVCHQNVMSIFAASRDSRNGLPFLVMEFIDGVTLSSLKESLLKDRKKIAPLMLQAVEGLAACHAKGIVHRDIKPSNILITREGILKILDFGIAKTSAKLTKTGITMGTPEYMSPEQCMGSQELTGKSDIYSLGVIFWELIYGEVPFKADESTNPELSIALKHISGTLPAVSAIPDPAMAPLIPLIKRMMAKEAAERPEIEEIIEILEKFIEENVCTDQRGETSQSRRRSKSLRTSGIAEIINASAESPAHFSKRTMPSLKYAIIASIIIAAIALIYTHKNPGVKLPIPPKTRAPEEIQSEIRACLSSGKFDAARELLRELENHPEGAIPAQAIKPAVFNELCRMGTIAESEQNYVKAITFFSHAALLESDNATITTHIAELKVIYSESIQKSIRADILQSEIQALTAIAAPGSGTEQLMRLLSELEKSGYDSETGKLRNAFMDKFALEGEKALQEDPELALKYFLDLQKYFSETSRFTEHIEKAQAEISTRRNRESLSEAITQLTQSLDNMLKQPVADITPDTAIKYLTQLTEAGESKNAEAFRLEFERKYLADAALASETNPHGALALIESAKKITGETENLNKLRKDIQNTLDQTAAKELEVTNKKKIETCRKKIEAEIARLNPMADFASVSSAIKALSDEFPASEVPGELKKTLFQHYYASFNRIKAAEPENALKILVFCERLAVVKNSLSNDRAELESRIRNQALNKKLEALKKEGLTIAKVAESAKAKKLGAILTELESLNESKSVGEIRQAALSRLENQASAAKSRKTASGILMLGLEYYSNDDEKSAYLESIQLTLEKISRRKIDDFSKFVSKFVPGSKYDQLKNRLDEAENWEITAGLQPIIEALRDKHCTEIRKAEGTKPDLALKMLTDICALRHFSGDIKLAALRKQLQESIASRNKPEPAAPARPEVSSRTYSADSTPDSSRPLVQIREPSTQSGEITVGPAEAVKTLYQALQISKAGMTIKLKPGKYQGQYILEKDVSIVGQGDAAGIILESPAGTVVTISGRASISNVTISCSAKKMSDTVSVLSGAPIIRNCKITNTAPSSGPDWSAAISVKSGSPKIANNTIASTRAMGILVRSGSPVIEGNNVQNCGIYGVWCSGNIQGMIVENVVSGCKRSGIGLKNNANPQISKNTITGNNENGIMIYQGGGGTVLNNTLSDNGFSGIEVTQSGSAVRIAENRISNNRKHGIYVNGSGSRAGIGDNIFAGNRGKTELAEKDGRIDKL